MNASKWVEPPPARVRGNDWRTVDLPTAFVPHEPVSVVLPCYQDRRELAVALAALERQTYPSELIEVVVVDDGSEPPITIAPNALEVRLVRQPRRGFGLARARNRGARTARHPVIVFLDADLVAAEGLIEAHARWHHAVSDALTLGSCTYVGADDLDAATLRAYAGPLATMFRGRPADPPWTARHMSRTGALTAPRDDLFRAVVGNNLGIRRTLFEEIGGFAECFDRYGWEDTEFGWRAQTRGALLVPVRGSDSWHLGRFGPNRSRRKRDDVAAQCAKAAGLIPHSAIRPPRLGVRWVVPRTVVSVGPGPDAPSTARCLHAGEDTDIAVVVEPGPDDVQALSIHRHDDACARLPAGVDVLDAFPASAFHVSLTAGAAVDAGLLPRLRAGLGAAAVGVAKLPDGSPVIITRAWLAHRARRSGGKATSLGRVAVFALPAQERGPWKVLLRRLRRLVPPAPRPLGGIARVAAELRLIRGRRDASRVLWWLAKGFAWWLQTRRGHRARRLVPSRASLRRWHLARLALHRVLWHRPTAAGAAFGLLLAPSTRRSDWSVAARTMCRRAGAGKAREDTLRRLATELAECAHCAAHAAAARAVSGALAAGDRAAACRLARTASRQADLCAEKIVSLRYRFVWIANPKVASRSLIQALKAVDPGAMLVRHATLAEVYEGLPQARAFFSFAFVRDPVARAISCHADKTGAAGNVSLDPFAGLAKGMDFDAYCAWLETPWGADTFADRHWLSQDVILRETADGPLPNYLGRFENLAADLAAVASRLGMPLPPLPHLNRRADRGEVAPSDQALAALGRRYARDFALGGYQLPEPVGGRTG